MRKTPFLSPLFALAFALIPAVAAEPGDPAPLSPESGMESREVWPELAGWREEIEAENLELRDELVAAELGYLAALDKALLEAADIPGDDHRHALAWARIEYLMETAFRLLDQTGEYEGFMKSTLPLAPEKGNPFPAVRISGNEEGDDGDGGLIFEDAEGRRLVKTFADGVATLRDAETGGPADLTRRILARSVGGESRRSSTLAPIKARAAWLRAMALLRTGRSEAAEEEAAGLGIVRNWLLLGPLDGDPDLGTSLQDEGPREVLDALNPDVSYAGKNGPVSWRAFTSVEALGRLLPEAAFGMDDPSMAYALALVRSPDNRPAAIRFGSTGAATVWVNHTQVRESPPDGFASPDQDVFDVWLRAGWNAILVKTMSAPDGWNLILRVTGLDGEPFPGEVAMTAVEDIPLILSEARRAAGRAVLDRYYLPDAPADQGGMSLLARRLFERPDDARAFFYLGSLLTAKRLMEGVGRFDRETIFRRAVELSGGDPFFLLMAARASESGVEGPDREENLRLVLLRLAAEKGSAAALVDMGRLYLDVMRQPRRAGDFAARALAVNPVSHRAGVLEYDVAVARGWKPLSREYLEDLRARHPDAAAVRLRSGRAAMERGRYRQALSDFHALLEIDAANGEALFGAMTALGRLGQSSSAEELLVRHLRRFPYDSVSRVKLAELYRGMGRIDDALAAVGDELDIRPDSPEALAVRSEILRERLILAPAAEAQGATPVRASPESRPPSPEAPREGWEYLYFQLEDRLRKNGSLDRYISFAAQIHTPAAATAVRHLGFTLDGAFEAGSILDISAIQADGTREKLSSPRLESGGDAIKFDLPPLTPGTTVEAVLHIRRGRVPFLGDYFGQTASLSQPVPTRLYRYMFSHPRERRFYFHSVNGAPEALILPDDGSEFVTHVWEMEDVPGFVREPDAPNQKETTPSVEISSFADWDEFARWYWRLIGTQYHTPPELRLLAERAGGIEPFPMARLDRVSEWIADNLGARKWEFGLYAFRPISVRAILSRRSADAKDRTLILCLLADAYGLQAWPVLAGSIDPAVGRSGEGGLGLPLLDHFSHSLASVVTGAGGNVLLDASSPNRPPGILPTSLFGTSAVMITPTGGERIVIPDSGILGCEWSEESELTVDEDGSVLWEQKVRAAGTGAEALRSRFESGETRETSWTAFLSGLGATVSASACDFADSDPSPAHALFSGRARIRHLARTTDKRTTLRLPPLPGRYLASLNQYEYPLSVEKFVRLGEREQSLLLPSVFRITRRIGVSYPIDWRLENPPVSMNSKLPFGEISLSVAESSGQIQVEFVFEVSRKLIRPEEYPVFRKAAAFAERWYRPFLSWEKP